jgi:hypothetical protein
MRQGQASGTIPGELLASIAQFKQFSMERLTTHLMRVLTDGPMENRVARGLAFVLLSTAAGAVSLQAAAIAAGKTPADMADPKFWAEAFTRGGAGGLYGDLLSGALFGGRDTASMLGQMAGPVPGFIADTASLVSAPIRQELDPSGRKSAEQTFADKAFAAGRRWTPSTFYTKAAVDRLLWDKLQTLVDPDYRQSFRRLERQAAKHGQGYWWAPGQGAPALGR